MNAASMICENNQKIKYKVFPEECFKLCYNENMQTDLNIVLKHNKRQDICEIEYKPLLFI